MPRLSESEEMDDCLEDALGRLENPAHRETIDSFKEFSKLRFKIFSAITNLKDSAARKQELIGLVEDMSVQYFQIGVKLNKGVNVEDLSGRLSGLESKIDNLSLKDETYADKAKISKVDRVQIPQGGSVVPAPKKALLITPINIGGGLSTCEDTKKTLLDKIKPADLGIRPDRLLKNGKAGIKIEASNIDLNKINKNALTRVGLKCEVLGKFRPRLAVFVVPADAAADTVRDEIVNTLNLNSHEGVDVKSKFGPRGKHYSHWVVETSPAVRRELLALGRVYIGWPSCIVKDHIRIIRCYGCQKFGHQMRECKGEVTCAHCAGGHDTRGCERKDGPPRCANCSRGGLREVAHEAGSAKCQTYGMRIRDMISSTDYGQ